VPPYTDLKPEKNTQRGREEGLPGGKEGKGEGSLKVFCRLKEMQSSITASTIDNNSKREECISIMNEVITPYFSLKKSGLTLPTGCGPISMLF